MSIKQNVDYIKDELNSEEKFLESFVKVERFYKKNKIAILGISAAVIIGVAGYTANNYIKNSNKIAANEAYSILLEDINNKEALATLKSKNPKLAQIIEAKIAIAQNKTPNIDLQYLKELSQYTIASRKNDLDQLNKVLMEDDFLLKEYALFQKALLQAQNKKYTDAKETLKMIPKSSSVQQLASLLQHFLLTK
jgi:hypothetical protein